MKSETCTCNTFITRIVLRFQCHFYGNAIRIEYLLIVIHAQIKTSRILINPAGRELYSLCSFQIIYLQLNRRFIG